MKYVLWTLTVAIAGAWSACTRAPEPPIPSVAATDLMGSTLRVPGLVQSALVYLGDREHPTYSTADQARYCAGAHDPEGVWSADLRWSLVHRSSFPVLQLTDRRRHVEYPIDSLVGQRLYVRERTEHGYRPRSLVLTRLGALSVPSEDRLRDLLNNGPLNTLLDGTLGTPNGPGFHLDPGGRFSVFTDHAMLREGHYEFSPDRRWVILDGGCAPRNYWRVTTDEANQIRLDLDPGLIPY